MVKNGFDKGPEGWCSYDYHASVVSGSNVFILTPWEKGGGVAGDPPSNRVCATEPSVADIRKA